MIILSILAMSQLKINGFCLPNLYSVFNTIDDSILVHRLSFIKMALYSPVSIISLITHMLLISDHLYLLHAHSTRSVPQGSVLDTLLYMHYIHHYADDTQLFISFLFLISHKTCLTWKLLLTLLWCLHIFTQSI